MDPVEQMTVEQLDTEIETLQEKQPWATGDETGVKRLSELYEWRESKRGQASAPEPVQGFRPVRQMSRQDMELEARELMDINGPWGKGPAHPRYKTVMARLEELHRALYPNPTPAQKKAEEEKFKREVEAREQRNLDLDRERAAQRSVEQLKMEWGRDYEQNLGLAKAVLERFGTEEDADFLEASGLGNDPELIRLLHRLGEKLQSAGKGYKLR
jgi:hypothetical protein